MTDLISPTTITVISTIAFAALVMIWYGRPRTAIPALQTARYQLDYLAMQDSATLTIPAEEALRYINRAYAFRLVLTPIVYSICVGLLAGAALFASTLSLLMGLGLVYLLGATAYESSLVLSILGRVSQAALQTKIQDSERLQTEGQAIIEQIRASVDQLDPAADDDETNQARVLAAQVIARISSTCAVLEETRKHHEQDLRQMNDMVAEMSSPAELLRK